MNKKQKKMLVRIIIATVTLAAAKLTQAQVWVSTALYLVSYAVIGWAEHAEGFYRKSLKKVFEIPDSQASCTASCLTKTS